MVEREGSDPCSSLSPAQQCPLARGNHGAQLVHPLPIVEPGLKGADTQLLVGALGAEFPEGGTLSEK